MFITDATWLTWLLASALALVVFVWAVRSEQQALALSGHATLSRTASLSLLMALASLVVVAHLGIFRPFTLSLLAIGCGIVSIHQIRQSSGRYGGVRMAAAGILLAGVQVALFFLSLARLALLGS